MLSASVMRSAASVRILVEVAAEYGISPETALVGTGLQACDLADLSREIRSLQEKVVIENIVGVVGDRSDFALTAGPRYSLDVFGMIGFALMSSPTLRDTVDISLRYQDLAFTLARCSLARHEGVTAIQFDVGELPATIRRFVVELSMATVWLGMRELGKRQPSGSLELAFGSTGRNTQYREVFGCVPTFDTENNSLLFDDWYLDAPRGSIDPQALELCEQQCMVLLARRHAVDSTAVVRGRLEDQSHCVPTMTAVAGALNTSPRTLRRALQAEGTTFRRLDEDVRRRRAEALLAESDLALSQIADRLGYATPSVFVRAFKRWHGIPPGRWRKRESA